MRILYYFCCCLYWVFVEIFCGSVPRLNITVVTYGSPKKFLTISLPYTAPAYELAVEEIRESFNYHVQQIFIQTENITTCQDLDSYSYLVPQYYYKDKSPDSLFVIALPGCDELVTLGELSREWNTLILSSGNSFGLKGRHDVRFPTAVSFSVINFDVWGNCIAAILTRFQWTSISIIYDRWGSNSFYTMVVEKVQELLKPLVRYQIQLLPVSTTDAPVTDSVRQEALLRARNTSRIIFLAFRADETRNFMITAAAMGMTNSEYVYFTVEPYRDVEFFGRLQASVNDTSDSVAKNAFKYLFQITGTCTKSLSEGTRRLQDQIIRRSLVEYGVKYRPGEDPSESVLASYFSVKTLGIVIDEALAAGADVYNGAAMARRFFNHTWYLNDRTINIDPMGDRIMDLCMRAFDNDSDTFRNVMYYDPTLTTLSELENKIKWYTENGTQPPNEPRCGFKGDNSLCAEPGPGIALVAGTAVPAVILFLVASLCGIWRFRREVELKDNWWLGNKADLVSPDAVSNRRYSISRHTSPSYSLSTMGKDPKHFRTYRGNPVWIFKVQTVQTFFLNRSKRTILREMKLIPHVNLVHLQGLLIDKETLTFLYEFCQKGCLAHLLERMNLDWEFRAGLIHDLLEGVVVIHQSLIRRHGYLSPFTCLIDQRFTLKIAEFGMYDLIKDVATPEMSNKLSENTTITYANTAQWIAPELQAKYKTNGMKNVRTLAAIAGPEADVYAVGGLIDIVMEENLALDDADAPPRYSLSGIRTIVEACQHYQGWRRPMAEEVKRRFVIRTGARSGGFLESLVRRMEMYARRMEFAVRERTEALKAERKVCEKLLEEMLPKSIVEMLRSGYAVEPEHFSRVTIFFSVIVGFVEFVSDTSPMEVIDFLNSIFSSFDAALCSYDVYKVETISDCYMVASGLPKPNEQHAVEISRMSVHLLSIFRKKADHLNMQIKIGLHSGPCAAGVVGSKRPRYCLFGDTVNTASRMATHGKPSKIHISSTTCALILHLSEYVIKERGIVELKGKGKERTFWLISADEYYSTTKHI